jgi:hypothetical protein
MMWVPDQQMSALAGSSVELNCYVESHPEALCTDEPKGVNASEVRRQLKSIPFRVEYISI